jgi:hypothetical protein
MSKSNTAHTNEVIILSVKTDYSVGVSMMVVKYSGATYSQSSKVKNCSQALTIQNR